MLARFLFVCFVFLHHACASQNEELFGQFMSKFGRSYSTHHEHSHAFHCFEHNLRRIEELNAKNSSATFGVTQFADLCPEEFRTRILGGFSGPREHHAATDTELLADLSALPKDVDWRKKNAVTPVKNEGECGLTWAFSAVGTMEGQHAIHSGKLVSLSTQEIGSCDKKSYCCDGGLMDNAYQWVIQNGGIDSEADWKYHSGKGACPPCNITKAKHNIVAKFAAWKAIPKTEQAIQTWTAKHGPVSIAVDASSWQLYTGGVMTNCKGHQLDHAVLIAGYSQTSAKQPYWIVKNQWGTSWGIDGYIYLQMGTNQCGMQQDASTICIDKACAL
eukprot:TRINITY_DN66016_c11_g2_i1.p1 TRINITY_DN66016_c11_g2~~TRINITY_DN66016_c11_g2_i1.p1  ORF type:complete len:339 (+),score=57.31 TRINITY_DN66016_c11_g2_i1:26-1018(+)